MLLLVIYVVIALGFSFVCSVAEAVILSVSNSFISVAKQKGKQSAKLLESLTADINRPLSAILTLNTIAHTMGAAGAGAQAAVVFGDAYLGLASAILTLLILIFSEIIPKTLGATYWKQLAPVTAYFLHYLGYVMYPFVKLSHWITKGFKEENPSRGLNRNEFAALTQLSQNEGLIDGQEAEFLLNVLKMRNSKVKDAMTHRTAIFSVSEDLTVETFFHKHENVVYSRIPVYEEKEPEKISGFVLRSDLLLAQARGNVNKTLREYQKDMVALLSSMPLAHTFNYFLESRAHMLLVVDEYGGLEGILTLEDLLESILGLEIVDENDQASGLKKIIKSKNSKKRRVRSKQIHSPD